MKVRTIKTFKDLKEKKLRKAGEVFECSGERYEEILKVGAFVEEVPDAADAATDVPTDEMKDISAEAAETTADGAEETDSDAEPEKKTAKTAKKTARKKTE